MHPLLVLQRAAGNRGVSSLVRQSTPQSGLHAVQRDDDVVTMDPLTVTGRRSGAIEGQVANLDTLRGQGSDPNGVTMTRDEETVNRNAPDPADPLPFLSTGGWNATDILDRLGQYDRLAGTDSDAVRCVQAVAIASYIPSGPDAVAGYLASMRFEALQRPPSARITAGMRVIELVRGRLQNRTATFGDMSWAQEAVHDVFYDDVSGTPEGEIANQVTPMLEILQRDATAMNVWCNTPAEVMAVARTLPPGGQLLVDTWKVVFNATFDQLEMEGHQTRDRMRVNINGRMRTIRRVDASSRPDHTRIDAFSDSRSGHQLLIMRDNVPDGPLRLYEPEVTETGHHLITLGDDGAGLTLTDDPANGIYDYIQILAQLTPRPPPLSFGAAAAAANP